MDWFDLLAVQGTQESLPIPQFKSINSLVLSFLCGPTLTFLPDYIALTRRTFVGKIMSLLFNLLSRVLITFLPKSKCLHFMAAVTICSDFGAPKIKFVTVSIVCSSICHEEMGSDAVILVF